MLDYKVVRFQPDLLHRDARCPASPRFCVVDTSDKMRGLHTAGGFGFISLEAAHRRYLSKNAEANDAYERQVEILDKYFDGHQDELMAMHGVALSFSERGQVAMVEDIAPYVKACSEATGLDADEIYRYYCVESFD